MGVSGPIRVVVAKPGLDGHDRGAKVIARALRDAGMEVIYTGLHQTPEQIVDTAIQEDADAIGLSILSGAHNTLFAKVIELLKERDAADIKVFGGGIIPEADIAPLKEQGVAEIFTPGATTVAIVDWVNANVRQPHGGLSPSPRPTAAVQGLRRCAVWCSPPRAGHRTAHRPLFQRLRPGRRQRPDGGVARSEAAAPQRRWPGLSSRSIAARSRKVETRRWNASDQ